MARIATRAIWRLKLDETLLTPIELGAELRPRGRRASLFCCVGVSDFVRIWKLLYVSLPVDAAAALDDGVAAADRARLGAHVRRA